MAEVGVVAIGRNEGERLRRCLESVVKQVRAVVYVDSNSTDGSVDLARGLGVECVQLDLSVPFTAARARNGGFDRLLQAQPQLEYVLFVDGDCEVLPGFLERALQTMEKNAQVAAVCGRRRERFPTATRYNLLCDLEWNTPVGEADACGGDVLMRVAPFQSVGKYRPELIAGEEPELCHRLRLAGWKIMRIDADMTLHDAAMTRFSQWWKRSVRAGWAFASNYQLTRSGPAPMWGKEYRSNWVWGLGLLFLPFIALALAPFTCGLSALLVLLYPLQMVRIYRSRRRHGDGSPEARVYAFFTVLGKIPQMFGQVRYHQQRWRAEKATLIEYK